MMETNQFAKAEMLIRKQVDQVFHAFINPEVTTKFWFTKSSGKLEEGKQTVWTWEMYNHSISVLPKKIEPNKKILIEWGNYENLTTVTWTFKPFSEDFTFVSIVNNGFNGDIILPIFDTKGLGC